MRWIGAFVCAWSLTAEAAIAETPEAVAEQYFESLRTQDWEKVTELSDPLALHECREILSWVSELDDDDFSAAATVVFGFGTTKKDLAAMSDRELVLRFISGALRGTAEGRPFDFKRVQILGAVPEGDVTHVVARCQSEVYNIRVEAMQVVSLRQSELGWRILIQDLIENQSKALRKALDARPSQK